MTRTFLHTLRRLAPQQQPVAPDVYYAAQMQVLQTLETLKQVVLAPVDGPVLRGHLDVLTILQGWQDGVLRQIGGGR